MSDYVTVDELREWISSDTTNYQDVLASCCTVASREIEAITDRVFIDGGGTARYYAPDDPWTVEIDDLSDTAGLVVQVDFGYNRGYGTTFTLNTDFIVEPVNQSRGGLTWPYDTLTAVGLGTANSYFPPASRLSPYTVKVTSSHWGWAAVPDVVKHATKLMAANLFAQKDAPGGYIGVSGWGPTFLRDNPMVLNVLRPYMRSPIASA